MTATTLRTTARHLLAGDVIRNRYRNFATPRQVASVTRREGRAVGYDIAFVDGETAYASANMRFDVLRQDAPTTGTKTDSATGWSACRHCGGDPVSCRPTATTCRAAATGTVSTDEATTDTGVDGPAAPAAAVVVERPTPAVTYQDRVERRTGSHAHQVIVVEHTDVFLEGERVHTVTWQPALLRRLERMERTREQYLEGVARRYLPEPRYYARCAMNGARSWDVYVGERNDGSDGFGLGPVVIAYTGRCIREEQTEAPLELARQMADALNAGTATEDSIRRQAAVRLVGKRPA